MPSVRLKRKRSRRKRAQRPSPKRVSPRRLSDSHPTPAGVASAAADGLRLVQEGYGGGGLTQGAITRARALAAGRSIPRETVRMMRNWFRRHHVDRRPDWAKSKTPGWVAWQLWGGNAGWRWAERLEGGDWTLPAWAM